MTPHIDTGSSDGSGDGFIVQRLKDSIALSAGRRTDHEQAFGVERDVAGLAINVREVSPDGFTVHVFTEDGTFVCGELWAQTFLVGGGGAGGAGGGGAGGVLYRDSHAFAAGSYPVIVGAGGAGSTDGTYLIHYPNGLGIGPWGWGMDGEGTSIGDETVPGGGGGGGGQIPGPPNPLLPGRDGGSGGGGGYKLDPYVYASPGGIAVDAGAYGHDGGVAGPGYSGGGGGGAGAVGGTGDGGVTGGHGGAGITSDITGTSVGYAGGGQGGGALFYGLDWPSGTEWNEYGGGQGVGYSGAGWMARQNSGGGGSGAGNNVTADRTGGAGGSGLVVVRYDGPPQATGGTITFHYPDGSLRYD